jgi:hypothetical protein
MTKDEIVSNVNKMLTEHKLDIANKKKQLEENLSSVELERALFQLSILEDLYDDVHSYLHKLNRITKDPFISLGCLDYAGIIENSLKTMQSVLFDIRTDVTYNAVKDILKERGGKK